MCMHHALVSALHMVAWGLQTGCMALDWGWATWVVWWIRRVWWYCIDDHATMLSSTSSFYSLTDLEIHCEADHVLACKGTREIGHFQLLSRSLDSPFKFRPCMMFHDVRKLFLKLVRSVQGYKLFRKDELSQTGC